MANRFAGKKKKYTTLKDILLPIAVFLLIGTLFFFAIESVDATSQSERLRSVEKAITRATVQCYAVEGVYPPSIAYLEDNYGLVLDTEKYIIQYDAFASNIMPTILVLPREYEESETAGGFFDEDGV